MTSIRDIATRSSYTALRDMCYSNGIAFAKMMPGLDLAKRVSDDYVRVSALELVAQEIEENNVLGTVTELGVFKGEFAGILNMTFSRRPLYLFDTFEGFAPADVEYDRKRDYATPASGVFADTSVESVLSKMPFRDRCIVKKGWFTASAEDSSGERFCFVSFDVDLYGPMYEGLRFFWPRLNAGGYIFVHDYNNDEYRGTKEAVRQFCAEQAVAYTPLLDACGTAILAKPIGAETPPVRTVVA